ncbi:GrpB family protein [Acidobacteria bacterium AB60]|nr:GrpB family protein [Acidobacteria bacterium AB60]
MHDRERARRALGPVSIAPPDPSWPQHFARERDRLRPFLGPRADQLQHYGSTAVPGLSAKPIIDMMGPVDSLAEADLLGHNLIAAGYHPIDAGFLKRRFFRRGAEHAPLAWHLHLVVAPAWPIKNELLLRDWLIHHPAVARAYQALKLRLAQTCGDDMPRYTDGKTAFLRSAVNDARRSLGLPPEQDWDE